MDPDKPRKDAPAPEITPRKGPELPPPQGPDEVGRRAGRVGGVEHRDEDPEHEEVFPPLEPGETHDPDADEGRG